jgi:hypothetical protein
MARKLDANFQALFAGQFLVIIAVRLLCLGEAGKAGGLFLHPKSIGESRYLPKTNHGAD